MPNLLSFERALSARRILVTGHTGFTGGWLCCWLHHIGADIHGFSLAPETSPNLYHALDLSGKLNGVYGDIRDYDHLANVVDQVQPDLIIHLAAQPLVRRSFREPASTMATNAQGTANVLEAARQAGSVRAVLCVTTDKVYENKGWIWPYRENDELGGSDPYSASKVAAETIIRSYRDSFDADQGKGPYIAVARGGNIIGGGDWAEDRLIPDFVRAVVSGEKITLRYPDATRPWQHVLALVHGYIRLSAGLLSDHPARVAGPWNFGPADTRPYTVRDVVDAMARFWREPDSELLADRLPEEGTLGLDSRKARQQLGWTPVWTTEEAIERTMLWYRSFYEHPEGALETTTRQIDDWRQRLNQ